MRYFSLLVRENKKAPWCIEFGDYDKDVVKEELKEYKRNTPINCLKIITTSDAQDAINHAVKLINQDIIIAHRVFGITP